MSIWRPWTGRPACRVATELTVINHLDEIVAREWPEQAGEVRSITLPDVLCDTGATTLCLPQPMIDQLGLHAVGEVTVSTAAGLRTARIYEDAKITIEGRTGTFECVALPEGTEPLLGVIPLERLGLELDLQNQRLVVLPDRGRRTYILAPSPTIL